MRKLLICTATVILNVAIMQKRPGSKVCIPAIYHMAMGDFLREYKESGLKIRVWTVNETGAYGEAVPRRRGCNYY